MTRPQPPALTTAAALVVAVPAFQIVALVHGGMMCWIQGLNYLVAAVPFTLSSLNALAFKRTRQTRMRRLSFYYFVIFLAITAYAFDSVRRHQELIATEETALQPVIQALTAYHDGHGAFPQSLGEAGLTLPADLWFRAQYDLLGDKGYTLRFTHNILRKHQYLSESGTWIDWD
jgi:hypothetical protein